jgi:hypothetical protein
MNSILFAALILQSASDRIVEFEDLRQAHEDALEEMIDCMDEKTKDVFGEQTFASDPSIIVDEALVRCAGHLDTMRNILETNPILSSQSVILTDGNTERLKTMYIENIGALFRS